MKNKFDTYDGNGVFFATNYRQMMRLISVAVICLTLFSFGVKGQQNAVVNGKVLDFNERIGLPGATVSYNKLGDTMVIGRTSTSVDGSFKLRGKIGDSIMVNMRYLGYDSYETILFISAKQLTLPPVGLFRTSKALEEVEIIADRSLKIINGDTTEYRASALKTPPRSSAGDVILRLPGLTKFGPNLYYNGQRIGSILVDGKPLFANSSAEVFANIPAELISKIQIHDSFDKESKKFNRFSRSGDTRTINIKLKTGNKVFANTSLKGGTSGRYEIGANGTLEKDGSRLSVTGNLNNVGGGGGNLGSMYQGGFGTAASGKFNYQNKNFNTTYEVNRLSRSKGEDLFYDRYLSLTEELASSSTVKSNDKGERHVVQLDLGRRGVTRLNGITKFDYDVSSGIANVATETFGEKVVKNRLHNQNNTFFRKLDILQGVGFSDSIAKETFLLVSSAFNLNRNCGMQTQMGEVRYFGATDMDSVQILNREINDKTRKYSILFGGTISKHLDNYHINIGQSLIFGRGKSEWLTSDLSATGGFLIHPASTSDILYKDLQSKTTLNVGYGHNKLEIKGGLHMLYTYQNYEDLFSYRQFLVKKLGLLPQLDFRYHNLIVTHETYVLTPDLPDLRPIVDSSNPLLLRFGNPMLSASTAYNTHVNYSTTPQGKSKKYNYQTRLYLKHLYTADKLTFDISYDQVGRQVVMPRNVDAGYEATVSLAQEINRQINGHSYSIFATVGGHYNSGELYFNSKLHRLSRIAYTPTLTIRYFYTANIDLNLSYSASVNRFARQLYNALDQNYTMQYLSASTRFLSFGKFKWGQNVAYKWYNPSGAADLFDSSIVWNANLSWLCFKNSGEIKLNANDLLNQNRTIGRAYNVNSFNSWQGNQLQRHFMVSFNYSFNKINS